MLLSDTTEDGETVYTGNLTVSGEQPPLKKTWQSIPFFICMK